MNRTLMIHLLFMVLGYALAVLVSTTVVVFCMGLPTIFPDQGNWGSFYRYLNNFPAMFAFGLMMTAIYALPGWLISTVTAEIRKEQRKLWFAIAGVLTATLAVVLAGFARNLFSESLLNIACLIGGFFGGLAYWAVVGKHSGTWKATKKSEPA